MPEPNFFVVGAARSGTTAIWRYLKQHPDIAMPGTKNLKEPSHFAEPCPTWARKYRDRDAYLELFANAGTRKAIGEASPSYLTSEGCAQRIYNAYPDARIVISLRQPARRAYSLYRFMCMFGMEWLPSFERALDAEDARAVDAEFQRKRAYWFGAYLYFRSSLYASAVKQYLDVFPRNQIHVLMFEDLARRPVETTQEIYKFLDVDPSFVPVTRQSNKSVMPVSTRVHHVVADRWRLHPLFRDRDRARLIDWSVYPLIYLTNLTVGQFRKTSLEIGTERRLLDRYRSDIAETALLIGRSLNSWLPILGLMFGCSMTE